MEKNIEEYEIEKVDFEVEITGLDFCNEFSCYKRYVRISWSAIGKDISDDFEIFQNANGQWFFYGYLYDQSEDRPLCAAILRALHKSKLSNRIYYALNLDKSLERIFKTMRDYNEYLDDD